MRFKAHVVSIACITAMLAAPVLADPQKEAHQAAESLLDHIDFESMIGKLLEPVAAQSSDMLADNLKQTLPQSNLTAAQQAVVISKLPQYREQIRALFHDHIGQLLTGPRGRALMVQVYEANFTAAEITQLDQFYASPVGQKMLQRQPQIVQQFMTAMQPSMTTFSQSYGQALQQATSAFVGEACGCDFQMKN